MLHHHHEHERQLTEADRERLVAEGATSKGMVLQSELSADDRRRSQIRVQVRFKDGEAVQFSEELATCISRPPEPRRRSAWPTSGVRNSFGTLTGYRRFSSECLTAPGSRFGMTLPTGAGSP